MANLSFNWLLAAMSGKACRHDDVYTKTNKQTGRSYAVKLCNPADPANATAAQKAQRSKFAVLSSAVSQWLTTEKASNSGNGSAAYNKALAAYKSQHKYGSLRGFVLSKYATFDSSTGKVTITVGSMSSEVNTTNSGGSRTEGSGTGEGAGGGDI